jgi:signal transduction histidine kinase
VYQDLVGMFLTEVLEGSRKKGCMTVRDEAGAHRTIEFAAFLEDRPAGGKRIRCTALESAPSPGDAGADTDGERLRHAQEIAGGLAHLMNQPLTILSNLIQDLLSRTPPQDPRVKAVEEICWQVAKLTDMVAKIRNIHRYEVMDYVAGVRILDVEKVS